MFVACTLGTEEVILVDPKELLNILRVLSPSHIFKAKCNVVVTCGRKALGMGGIGLGFTLPCMASFPSLDLCLSLPSHAQETCFLGAPTSSLAMFWPTPVQVLSQNINCGFSILLWEFPSREHVL